jgi:hypothetical protein
MLPTTRPAGRWRPGERTATRDIPWGDLVELDDDVEHAMCQLCTVLCEVEMIAADLPAKWMWRMNHDLIEAKMFLCSQINDEERHAEVFRKRALANGGGLLKFRSGPTSLLRTIIEAKTYTQATALTNLLGEGLDHDPDVAEEIHEALDHGEQVLTDVATAPDISTALTNLLGEGLDHVEDKEFPLLLELNKPQFSSYLARCERAGVSRLDRTSIPSGSACMARPTWTRSS